MKGKLLALILTALLAITALVSCNNQDSNNAPDDNKPTETEKKIESEDNSSKCTHEGGIATCKEKAICSSC
ncbi:MAG: hypothetical protein E7678_05485, partial [Ruminococcaceae bacterium]|nr:hypothetical protein [Oscillospiraceae bacterium]